MKVRITIDAEITAALADDEAILMGIAKQLAKGIQVDTVGEDGIFGKHALKGGEINVAKVRGPKKKVKAAKAVAE